jgi:thiamine-monophosphate kinase
MDEFSVIAAFFKSLQSNRSGIVDLSIGDDAALLAMSSIYQLVISTDSMVEGVHFLPDWPAEVIAYKLLATNVSDMAAMAATPKCISLAMTLPEINEQWLHAFSAGLKSAMDKFNVDLIGGDLTKGSLTLTLTIHGWVEKNKAIRRSTAQAGDLIYISGELGAGAYGVSQLGKKSYDDLVFNKLFYPEPRIDYCSILQNYANSAIDISDGLSSDLSHILQASGVGAELYAEKLTGQYPVEQAVNSGDEYELCFTVPPCYRQAVELAMEQQALDYYLIGTVTQQQKFILINEDGSQRELKPRGFQHFGE